MVNEPSVFEPLKLYCINKWTGVAFTVSPRGAVYRIRWEEIVVDWDCLVSRYISYKQVWPETEDQQSNILHVVKLWSI